MVPVVPDRLSKSASSSHRRLVFGPSLLHCLGANAALKHQVEVIRSRETPLCPPRNFLCHSTWEKSVEIGSLVTK